MSEKLDWSGGKVSVHCGDGAAWLPLLVRTPVNINDVIASKIAIVAGPNRFILMTLLSTCRIIWKANEIVSSRLGNLRRIIPAATVLFAISTVTPSDF